MKRLTQRQARQFMLLKHGLLGEYKFVGKEGALAFVRQCGCIQFDPIDVCGKNPELVLQSRVKGFKKPMLAGQVEAVADRKAKTLVVKNIWYEEGVRRTKKLDTAVNSRLKRFARFNGCGEIVFEA